MTMPVNTTYSSCKPVTPSDTADNAYTAFLVTGTGGVAFMGLDGAVVTLLAVPAWTVIPVQTLRIMAATTATGVFGLN
jgi:hypothetical protein